MTRPSLLLALLLTLTACGVDGPPTRPAAATSPGVVISGSVEAGITGGN